MPDRALDVLAIWLAGTGSAAGVFAVRRRAVTALTFIGASLSVLASAWLAWRTYGTANPLRVEHFAGMSVAVSFHAALLLGLNGMLVALLSHLEIASGEPVSDDRGWWLAVLGLNAALVVDGAVPFATAYLGAVLLVHHFSGAARTCSSAIGPAAAIVLLAGALLQSGRVEFQTYGVVRQERAAEVMIAVGILMTGLAHWPQGHGTTTAAYCAAVPFQFAALLTLNLGDQIGDRVGRLASLGAAALALYCGWKALRAAHGRETTEAFRAMLALLLMHWFLAPKSGAAGLAMFAAAACASCTAALQRGRVASNLRVVWLATPWLYGIVVAVVAGRVVGVAVNLWQQAAAFDAVRWLLVPVALVAVGALGLSTGAIWRTGRSASDRPGASPTAGHAVFLSIVALGAAIFSASEIVLAPSFESPPQRLGWFLLGASVATAGTVLGWQCMPTSRNTERVRYSAVSLGRLVAIVEGAPERFLAWMAESMIPSKQPAPGSPIGLPVLLLLIAAACGATLLFSVSTSRSP